MSLEGENFSLVVENKKPKEIDLYLMSIERERDENSKGRADEGKEDKKGREERGRGKEEGEVREGERGKGSELKNPDGGP